MPGTTYPPIDPPPSTTTTQPPTTTTTQPPTTTTTVAPTTTTPVVSTTPPKTTPPQLAETGIGLDVMAVIGVAVVVLGAATVRRLRRG